MSGKQKQKVVIVGAGPVGSLAALYAASRGDDVELYELRGDLRLTSTIPLNFTKSINLTLSERGITALKQSGRTTAVDVLLSNAVPLRGRMIHRKSASGDLWEAEHPYDVHGRCINSIDRGTLNNALLDELERTPNVKIFFNHKLTGADFRAKRAWFECRQPNGNGTSNGSSSAGSVNLNRAPEIEVQFDFLIGADGAHSATRYHMMKFARVDYLQEYIDALWCEFRIDPTEAGDFRISPNHLHIWPGQEFMFIALPSPDKSFTCTLFAPAEHYAKLEESPEQLFDYFQTHFPGVTPQLISPDQLYKQFMTNPHLPLISLKCKPHHFGSDVVIIGDAAHAMVPFYGQGLNAGMEDVRILFETLDKHGVYDPSHDATTRDAARAAALQAYTAQRVPDAHAINELSRLNYLEMRSGVTSRLYVLRKFIEETLDRYVPQLGWKTQYSRISFSNMPYSEVVKASQRQRRILVFGAKSIIASAILTAVSFGALLVWRFPRQLTPHRWLTKLSIKQFYTAAYAS